MDSLTQLVLGASVAEASAGKKLGNRALLWGAIAGTIPDLDVIANSFMSPLDALVFHRGITHSLFLEVVLALVLGYSVNKYYNWPYYKNIAHVLTLLVLGSLVGGSISLWGFGWHILGILIPIVLLGIYFFRLISSGTSPVGVTSRDWIKMFFWALITHPILDCFTTYGTQIFLPFSDARISFNNIAVADPLYTFPFVLGLVYILFVPRMSKKRRMINTAILVITSFYMLATIGNKLYINSVFAKTMEKNNIDYKRFMTTPTILNNFLWYGIAETDSNFIFGMYSVLDKETLFKIDTISKTNFSLIKSLDNDKTIQTLRWFSNDYFRVQENGEKTYAYYDLRFGTFRSSYEEKDSFVFAFNLYKDEFGQIILKDQGKRPKDANLKGAFLILWDRIKGI